MDANYTRRIGSGLVDSGTAASTVDITLGPFHATSRNCASICLPQHWFICAISERHSVGRASLLRVLRLRERVDAIESADCGVVCRVSGPRLVAEHAATISPESVGDNHIRRRIQPVRSDSASQDQAAIVSTKGLDLAGVRNGFSGSGQNSGIRWQGPGLRLVACAAAHSLLDWRAYKLSSNRHAGRYRFRSTYSHIEKDKECQGRDLSATSSSNRRNPQDFRSEGTTFVRLAIPGTLVVQMPSADCIAERCCVSQGQRKSDISHQAHRVDILLVSRSCDCAAAGRSFVSADDPSALCRSATCRPSCAMRSRRVARAETGNRSEISTRFPFPFGLSPLVALAPLCHPCSDRGVCYSSAGWGQGQVHAMM